MAIPQKTCASCGRTITWRKKWARDWDQVRYCSDACRRRGRNAEDDDLEAAIRSALTRSRTVSDVELAAATGADRETVRRAARRLVASGDLEIVQAGRVVDPSTAKGEFALRRRSLG